ncbi:putative longiborneol synthase [Diaporthe ampelina]|uniref:Putative longiborneol synthase n=1 Tax=Diaporthe ampelina TaxID=1214573 RepID=A0A0G2F7X3_9PEZI|nr:putative longiborneol synthase [Diaporthe ampelina]
MAPEHATKKRDQLVSTFRPLISNFLETIDYDPPSKPDRAALRAAMIEYAAPSGVPYNEDRHSRQCFETGLSVAIDMYPGHPLEVQLHIGIFTWLGFIIDDTNKRIASDLAHFQARFYTGQPQPSLLLDHFAQTLRNTYQYYDPIIANTIVLSALAFVNSNALEARREFQELVPSQAAASWPYYFRDKEGLPDTYSGFIFPKALYPDIGCFLQAIPDMGRFINLTNDILSFYKEEIAGETKNYVNSKAKSENKTAMTAMTEIVADTAQRYLSVTTILATKETYARAWHEYVMGYVAMHLINDRYMFADIGLDERFMHK